MTLRIYASRKAWPLERVIVRLRHSRIYATDCADCETKEGRIDRLERHIELRGALSAEQRQRLPTSWIRRPDRCRQLGCPIDPCACHPFSQCW